MVGIIDNDSIAKVAELMSLVKPEFWDYDGALNQLANGDVGFFMADDNIISGWLLCVCYSKYATLEIECVGYNRDGKFVVDHALSPLIDKAKEYAVNKGYRMLRFIIASRGLSCHKHKLGEIPNELSNLEVIDRDEYNWFKDIGFEPSGILPNCYGDGHHGIVLIKQI